MNDITNLNPENMSTAEARAYWKEQADFRGIEYMANIPTEKLANLVKEHIAEHHKESVVTDVRSRNQVADEAMKLIRFQLDPLDPSLKEMTCYKITVGNDAFNSPVTKVIPFGVPWHAEKIVVDTLRAKKYIYRPRRKNELMKGTFNSFNEAKYMPTFSVRELPPLTEEELKQLATEQSVNNTGKTEQE